MGHGQILAGDQEACEDCQRVKDGQGPIAPPWVDKQLGWVGAEPGRGPNRPNLNIQPIKKINGGPHLSAQHQESRFNLITPSSVFFGRCVPESGVGALVFFWLPPPGGCQKIMRSLSLLKSWCQGLVVDQIMKRYVGKAVPKGRQCSSVSVQISYF